MSNPLDLRAVEQGIEYYMTETPRFAGDVRKLLVALREARLELKLAQGLLQSLYPEIRHTQRTLERVDAIKAVLALVFDDVRSPHEAP